MRSMLFAALLFFIAIDISAQGNDNIVLSVNTHPFTKASNATFYRKSKLVPMGVYLDPNSWGVKAATLSENAEYNFIYKNKDIYGSMVTETSTIKMDDLPALVLSNFKDNDPDAELVTAEYRSVNGLQLLFMETKFTSVNILFHTFMYAYSNSEGTMRLSVTASDKMRDAYADIVQTFLNGFTASPGKIASSFGK